MTGKNPRPQDNPMIVYLANDLIWATKIKGAGDAMGLACRPVRTLKMLEDRLADSQVVALIADLDAGDRTFELIGRLRGEVASEAEQRIRVLVFGPHVDHDGLQRARQAGADEVLARGVFSANLPEIMLRLASQQTL